MAIFYWLLYGLKWKCWRIYNFCCNLFWVYGSIDWTIISIEEYDMVILWLFVLREYDMVIYHIFSGKYSSFEYLIKCQMLTLYHTLTLYRTPTMYTLLFKYMIKCIKHGKIRITLDQYHLSGLKALWMILVSRDDTAYDTDFDMYYSLYNDH